MDHPEHADRWTWRLVRTLRARRGASSQSFTLSESGPFDVLTNERQAGIDMTMEVLTAVQTLILAATGAVVAWYTLETKRIREASSRQTEALQEQTRLLSRQLEFLLEERAAQRKFVVTELHARISHIHNALVGLPNRSSQSSADRVMRTTPVWDAEDVRKLLHAATRHSDQTSRAAVELTPHLEYLLNRVHEVRGVSRQSGFDWTRFNWVAWDDRLSSAIESANAIRQLTDDTIQHPASL